MDKRQTSSFDERQTRKGPPVSSSAMFQAQRRASLRRRHQPDHENSNNLPVQRQFINRYNLALRESKYMVPKLCQPGCKIDHEHFGIYTQAAPAFTGLYPESTVSALDNGAGNRNSMMVNGGSREDEINHSQQEMNTENDEGMTNASFYN